MDINGLMTASSKSSQFCPWHIWHLPRSPEKFNPDRPAPAAATGEAPPAQPPWWWGRPCSEHEVLGDFPLSFENFSVVFWSMYDVWVILDVFASKVANWTNWSRFGDFDGPNIGAYPPKLSCNSKPSHNRGTWPLITMINIDQQYPLLLLLQGILQIPGKGTLFFSRKQRSTCTWPKGPAIRKTFSGLTADSQICVDWS